MSLPCNTRHSLNSKSKIIRGGINHLFLELTWTVPLSYLCECMISKKSENAIFPFFSLMYTFSSGIVGDMPRDLKKQNIKTIFKCILRFTRHWFEYVSSQVLLRLHYCRLNYWLFELLVVWTIARGTTCSSLNNQ